VCDVVHGQGCRSTFPLDTMSGERQRRSWRRCCAAVDDRELGSRIAYWRERRGMTQLLLADRIGRSKSWIEKVEAGKRSANRLPIIQAICDELRIDLPALIGNELPENGRGCVDDIQVEPIRASLERYDGISSEIPDTFSVNVPRMRCQVSYIWSAFESADYQVVSRTLPDLLLEAQRSYTVTQTRETYRILAEVYQITASTLRKLGEYELAWLAADRGVALAEREGDPIIAALTGFRVANALTSMGRARASFDLNVAYASRLQPLLGSDSIRSLYGHILLQAAMAAASGGDGIGVRDMIHAAAGVARRVPDHANHYRLSFGPVNVGMHHVAALVTLGEGGQAVRAGAAIGESGIRALRRERRATYLIDVARGYNQSGRRSEALEKLLEAETLAPREVNCRPIARSTIEDLIHCSRGNPSIPLWSLAERSGVTT
jgi:transcriptional regulator with XRE-family HTH domain